MSSNESKEPPPEVIVVADYLKATTESDFRLRSGLLNGRRVDFFKGKHAVNAVLRESYRSGKHSNRPIIKDRSDGEAMMQLLLQHGLFVRAGKQPKSKQLTISPPGPFSSDDYYIWVYQGSQIRGMLVGIGVLLLVLTGVMFPLWPASMRQGVYYLSLVMMGLMGALMALGVIRLILWLILLISLGRGGWLFPNLFADVGVIESFIPVWAWDAEKKSKKKSN